MSGRLVFFTLLMAVLGAVGQAQAQPGQFSDPTNLDTTLGDLLDPLTGLNMQDFQPDNPYDNFMEQHRAELWGLDGGGLPLAGDDCADCMPGPVIIRFPEPSNWPPPRPPTTRGNCPPSSDWLACLGVTVQAPVIMRLMQAPVTEQAGPTYYQAVVQAMADMTANDLCQAVLTAFFADGKDCADGNSVNGEDLIVEVIDTENTVADFTIKVVGRGMLLADVGNYESHTFDIIFALQLNGEPQVIYFNKLPLMTTWGRMDKILHDSADIKSIPRQQDNELASFGNKLITAIRNQLSERAVYAYSN